MASRMDRYKNRVASSNSRTSKNKNLYNTMYSFDRYSNIEGVASMENENEVDINKVKKMLESRDNYQRNNQYRKLSREVDDVPTRETYEKDDYNYDINDVLNSAKKNKQPDHKERVLNNTNYDILKKLNLKSEAVKEDISKEDDLKELIETISNTSMVNKNHKDDVNMLSDLVSDDTKVGDVKDITEFIEKEKTMDDSFFTHSVKIKKADYVGGGKKGGFLKKFFIFIFVLLILGGIACAILYYLGILKV